MSMIDLRAPGAPDQIAADVCIVGGGPAGITIALELMDAGLDVAVLESGGLAYDPEIQELHSGENVGIDYARLDQARLRYFGGSTNHWSGWCRPLDAEDFTDEPWSGAGAWPFTRSELEPYYPRATELCQLGSDEYDLDRWAGRIGEQTVPVDPHAVSNAVLLRSPPTRFGEVYGERLRRANDVTVYLHANVVEVRAAGDRVLGVRIAGPDGAERLLDADTVVVAAGGIENARLLLASDAEHRGGIGNDHDLVGRYFMEHPHFADITLLGPHDASDLALYAVDEPSRIDGAAVLGLFSLPPEVRHRAGIRNFSLQIRPLNAPREARFAQQRYRAQVASLLQGAEGVAQPGAWMCRVIGEQIPNPESRVTLGGGTDAVGMRRARLAWRLHPRDTDTLRIGTELVLRELGGLGFGRAQSPLHTERSTVQYQWGNHHMGTTRMHEDPEQGVVDPDGRVHGFPNLYVAGSSVFPTGGWANPTLTLVALAARLGRHLREEAA